MMQGAWLFGLTAYILTLATDYYYGVREMGGDYPKATTGLVIVVLAFAGFLGFMAGKG